MISMSDPQYLYKLAKSATPEARRSLADGISAVLADIPEDGGGDRAVAADILMELMRDAERDLKEYLSEKLAVEPNIPHELAIFLAQDEITVAEPVLKYSRVLTQTDLIDLVRDKTEMYWQAIAQRDDIAQELAYALIMTEDNKTVENIVNNTHAMFCERSMYRLIILAKKKVKEIQEPLLMRPEISPKLATELYWFVSAELRRYIMHKFHIQSNKIDNALEMILQEQISHKNGDRSLEQDMKTFARRLNKNGKINSSMLIRVLRRKNRPFFCHLLAEKTELPVEVINLILSKKDVRLLATVCQAADINKVDFTTIYLLTRPKEGAVTNSSQLNAAVLSYTRVKKDMADNIIGKWREHPDLVSLLQNTQ